LDDILLAFCNAAIPSALILIQKNCILTVQLSFWPGIRLGLCSIKRQVSGFNPNGKNQVCVPLFAGKEKRQGSLNGWCKVNVDGVFTECTGKAGTGVVIRPVPRILWLWNKT
jgi:hypothetical protein